MIGKLTKPDIVPEPLPKAIEDRMGIASLEALREAPPRVAPIEQPPPKPAMSVCEGLYLVAVWFLSIPTVFFAVVHMLYTPHWLPNVLDVPVNWIMTWTGIYGPILTVGALALTVGATLQKSVSWKIKALLWAAAGVSFISWISVLKILP